MAVLRANLAKVKQAAASGPANPDANPSAFANTETGADTVNQRLDAPVDSDPGSGSSGPGSAGPGPGGQ